MQYTINGVDSFLPTGSVLAYIGSLTSDPPGWIIADGVNRTDSTIYNKLFEMSIGTRPTGYYNPPNLKGAFLRAVGTNGSYTGPGALVQQSHAIKTHSHVMTQTAHTHNTDPSLKNPDGTNNSWQNSSVSNPGLAKISDGTSNVTTNVATNNDGTDPNLKAVAGIKILDTTSDLTITVTKTGDGSETFPFSYGVYWIIKI